MQYKTIYVNGVFLIPANATTPFAGNNSMENITQTTLSIEMIEGVDMIPVLQPTALRTNPLYSIYFNWFRFIAIGIIPFALLVSTIFKAS